MSKCWKASGLLVLLLLLPGAAGQGSHGLSDHHAFLGDEDVIATGASLEVQLNHTYFDYGTLWYSARVREGGPIRGFMVDGENLARYRAGESYQALEGTEDGPASEVGGLASTLPRGVYHLVLENAGAGDARVKWEVFLDPRFPGSGGPSETASSGFLDPFLLSLLVAAAVAGTVGAVLLVRRRS